MDKMQKIKLTHLGYLEDVVTKGADSNYIHKRDPILEHMTVLVIKNELV